MFGDLAAHLPRARAWTWSTFPRGTPEQDRAWRHAHTWWEEYRDGAEANLYIFGPPGVGKTGLAWCCARSDLDAAGAPELLNVRRWLRDRRSAIERGGPERDRLGEPLPDPHMRLRRSDGLVVLDDLGAERLTPFALEEIAGLVEERYDRLGARETIITSNYSPAELARRLGGQHDHFAGERVVSRLVEGARLVEFEGPNLRLAGTDESSSPLRLVSDAHFDNVDAEEPDEGTSRK